MPSAKYQVPKAKKNGLSAGEVRSPFVQSGSHAGYTRIDLSVQPGCKSLQSNEPAINQEVASVLGQIQSAMRVQISGSNLRRFTMCVAFPSVLVANSHSPSEPCSTNASAVIGISGRSFAGSRPPNNLPSRRTTWNVQPLAS